MDENRLKSFHVMVPREAPEGLRGAIMFRVGRLRARADALYLGSLSLAAFVSAAGGIYAFRLFVSALAESGFFRYTSLIFSDTGLVAANAREFLLSLADAVPVFGLGLFLAATFVFLGSVRLLAKKTRMPLGIRAAA